MYQLDVSKVKEVSTGAIRCDGTCGLTLRLDDSTFLDLNGLTLKQSDYLEKAIKKGKGIISIDDYFLTDVDDLPFEVFARRNGININ